MPAPVAHSEASLLGFLETEVGPVGVSLGLLTSDALLQAVYTTERLLGHAVAAEDDMLKLETIAVWLAWLAALNAATSQFDVSLSGGKRFLLSQQYEMISKRLKMAEAAASVYPEVIAAAGSGGLAYVGSMSTAGSPYGWPDEFA